MRPAVRIALVAASALGLTRFAEGHLPAEAGTTVALPLEDAATTPHAPCPRGALPDHGACIPVPVGPVDDGPTPEIQANAHRDRAGRLVRYEHIPRRPERPADYRRYTFPIPLAPGQAFSGSGYDLDRPDSEQRRGARFKAVGHGGIDLGARRGTPVHAVRLEHQSGDAEVLFVGDLFGTTVITRHTITESGVPRDYLVLHGHLERAAALRPGDAAPAGTTLGFVGDSGSPGVVHLHFEVRRVRDETRLRELAPRELVHNARTIVCDPRNVLELAP